MIFLFLFSGCKLKEPEIYEPETTHEQEIAKSENELHGIWISCYDIENTYGKSREEYKKITDEMFKNISEIGLNTAFIHMRAFSDALYQSDLFPTSEYIAKERGIELEYDPFAVILESAEKYGVSVHGWINPFRISYNADTSKLCENETAAKLISESSSAVAVLSSGIYYNPASTQSQKIILDGIREILSKYNIDGIHIDDYFYPEDSDEIDYAEYEEYISFGGKLEKSDWRRATFDAFVSSIYTLVKSYSPDLIFSISPGAKSDTNYNELYADCEKWLSTDGYADLIIPQLYFDFESEKLNFNSLLDEWDSYKRNDSVKIACGLALYKVGTNESKEWINGSDILPAQIDLIRDKGWNGFVLFSYSDLLRNEAISSVNKIKERIKVSE